MADELSAADEQAVIDLVRRIYGSYLKFNPDLMEACDTDDCTIWDLFEPDLVRGGPKARAEFRNKDMTDSRKRGPLSIDVHDPIVVDGWGDVAFARYYLSYEFKPPGALAGEVPGHHHCPQDRWRMAARASSRGTRSHRPTGLQ